MGDGSLSQEEIDALLTGAEAPAPASAPASAAPPAMGGGANYSGIGNAVNQAMQVASGPMNTLFGKQVSVGNASTAELPVSKVPAKVQPGGVVISVNLGTVPAIILLAKGQADKISTILMGGTQAPANFDDAHLSALGEFGDSIFSALADKLGSDFSDNLTASNSVARVFSNPQDIGTLQSPNAVEVSFPFSIDNENLGNILVFLDEAGPKKWLQQGNKPADIGTGGNMESEFTGLDDVTDLGVGGGSGGGGLDFSQIAGSTEQASGETQNMNPVGFPTFQTGSAVPTGLPPNYELLLDVQMVLTVELGRTTKYVKDVLKLGEGSIIELDKLAGEPVDLLINGKLIAKGEVVIIDENFGVRVTDIVAPVEKIAKLAEQA